MWSDRSAAGGELAWKGVLAGNERAARAWARRCCRLAALGSASISVRGTLHVCLGLLRALLRRGTAADCTSGGVNQGVFVDGSVRAIRFTVPAELFRRVCSCNDGEVMSLEDL